MVIADELLSLAIDDSTGKNLASGTNLDAALAAALLVELALTERISIAPAEAGWRERGKVTVINTAPTDDADLDAVLTRLVEKDGQKVKNLISPMTGKPISKGLKDRRLAALVQRGVLTEQRSAVWGIRTHPTLDPGPEQEVRNRLWSALVDGTTPTERTVALVALLQAAGIITKVLAVEDKKALKARAKRLSEGDWAAKAVKDAIAEMTAVMVAVTAGSGGDGGGS
ncbi:MAG TPA: GPP34 family phosphoprotein [Microlunatus sp.]|nr:GPP34 family phosphoprotein [Microlunatus sp.]